MPATWSLDEICARATTGTVLLALLACRSDRITPSTEGNPWWKAHQLALRDKGIPKNACHYLALQGRKYAKSRGLL